MITTELKKAGVNIEEHDDGVIVRPTNSNLHAATLDPSDDHRMAMAFGVLGSVFDGITVINPDCVSKTYPHFFDDLQTLHDSPKCIALVGMRACGKSNLAKRLAKKLNMKQVDTDAVFEKKHGPIAAFVEQNDWNAFRTEEEQAVADALKPGNVVSLGGGAIESEATRERLKNETVVVWMQASVEGTVRRLKETDRPPLTDLPLEEEVQQVLTKRNPLFEHVADIALPENTPYSKQVDILHSELRTLCSL